YFRLFFFFQAEDGIRDFHVTGVQTCALPISDFQYTNFPLKVKPVSLPLSNGSITNFLYLKFLAMSKTPFNRKKFLFIIQLKYSYLKKERLPIGQPLFHF